MHARIGFVAMVALAWAWVAAAAAGPPPHMPCMLRAGEMLQLARACDAPVEPGALLAAHEQYAVACLAAMAEFDREVARHGSAVPVGVVARARERERHLLDELFAGLSGELTPFRDECQVALLSRRVHLGDQPEWASMYFADLGTWLDMYGGDAPAAPRNASAAERRATVEALVASLGRAAARMARRAAGDTPASDADAEPAPEPAPDAGALAHAVDAQVRAWQQVAPHLSEPARRYLGRVWLGNIAGVADALHERLPTLRGSVTQGVPLNLVREVLSTPTLNDAQRERVRSIGADWIDRDLALILRAARARPAGIRAGEHPDQEPRRALAAECVDALRKASGEPWVVVRHGLTPAEAAAADAAGAAALAASTKAARRLAADDDARFAHATARWQPPPATVARDTAAAHARRARGLPARLTEADANALVDSLRVTDEQALVARTVIADVLARWDEEVEPFARSATVTSNELFDDGDTRVFNEARGHPRIRAALVARAQAWQAAYRMDDALYSALVAVVPPDRAACVRAWQRSRAAQSLPVEVADLPVPPDLGAAALQAPLSDAGRVAALAVLAETWEAAYARAEAARSALDTAVGNDLKDYLPRAERAFSEPPERRARADEPLAAYDACMQADTERVAAALGDTDAAAWRRAVVARRWPGTTVTLDDVRAELLALQASGAALAAGVQPAIDAVDRMTEPMHACMAAQVEALATLPSYTPALHQETRLRAGPAARAEAFRELADDLRLHTLWQVRAALPADLVPRVRALRALNAWSFTPARGRD